jgi:hypothetical protein
LKATASSASVGTLALQPDGFFDGKIFDPNDLPTYLASFGSQRMK